MRSARGWRVGGWLALVLLALAGCGRQTPEERLAGLWAVDMAKTKDDPEIKQLLKDDPLTELALAIHALVRFEFTADEVRFTVGERTEISTYKVQSAKGDNIVLTVTPKGGDATKKEGQLSLTFLDAHTLKVAGIGEQMRAPLVLARQPLGIRAEEHGEAHALVEPPLRGADVLRIHRETGRKSLARRFGGDGRHQQLGRHAVGVRGRSDADGIAAHDRLHHGQLLGIGGPQGRPALDPGRGQPPRQRPAVSLVPLRQ